jgi:hypothetical protein
MTKDGALLTGHQLIDDLERVLKLILAYPQGLSILLGRVSPPLSLSLLSAFPARTYDSMGIHSSQRPYEERLTEMSAWVDGVIEQAGGWEHITRCVRLWRNEHRDTWNMVAEHMRNVAPRSGFAEARALRQIADKYGVSERTVSRRRRLFARLLAGSVLDIPLE